jgi:hypothetical protein
LLFGQAVAGSLRRLQALAHDVDVAALVIPLSKIVPPLYVWRVRSRVYRWYGELRAVEQAWEGAQGVEAEPQREIVRADLLKRLDEIEEQVNHISVPLAYADGLYGLRGHINIVRQRLQAVQLPGDGLTE